MSTNDASESILRPVGSNSASLPSPVTRQPLSGVTDSAPQLRPELQAPSRFTVAANNAAKPVLAPPRPNPAQFQQPQRTNGVMEFFYEFVNTMGWRTSFRIFIFVIAAVVCVVGRCMMGPAWDREPSSERTGTQTNSHSDTSTR